MLRYCGQSGKRYSVLSLLQEKQAPLRFTRVYIASTADDGAKFVLKEIPPPDLEYQRQVIQPRIQQQQQRHATHGNPHHLRLPTDVIPEHSMLVYPYRRSHLLNLVQELNLPLVITKRVLKNVLQGLTELHDANIKANNIMIDGQQQKDDTIMLNHVELADLEDAVYLSPGTNVVGSQIGNMMWRSPEAHAEARVNTYSDMFSFGAVCVYAVTEMGHLRGRRF